MHRALSIFVVCGCALLGGCAGMRSTTTLTSGDIDATTSAMAAKLAASKFLQDRTADSPRMVVAISKVENLSSDLIPEGEQWLLMQKVRDSLPIVQLGKDKNLVFVIPAEHLRAGQRSGNLPLETGQNRKPTHEMDATFRSATRSRGIDRTDAYLVEYRVTDLANGELVWDESFEFKRIARGLSYD
jgi:hypothetical protein